MHRVIKKMECKCLGLVMQLAKLVTQHAILVANFFFKLLQCDRGSHEHLKYFRNVYCVMTNHSRDENTLISQKTAN